MGLFGFKREGTARILLTQFENLKTRVNDSEKNFQDNRRMINDLQLEIEKFKSQLISLRGLVNRKLGDIEGVPEKERIKSVDGLDDLR